MKKQKLVIILFFSGLIMLLIGIIAGYHIGYDIVIVDGRELRLFSIWRFLGVALNCFVQGMAFFAAGILVYTITEKSLPQKIKNNQNYLSKRCLDNITLILLFLKEKLGNMIMFFSVIVCIFGIAWSINNSQIAAYVPETRSILYSINPIVLLKNLIQTLFVSVAYGFIGKFYNVLSIFQEKTVACSHLFIRHIHPISWEFWPICSL